jgi:hypothetical protein
MSMMARTPSRYEQLPGFDLIAAGVADLAAGRQTPAAMLVASFASRLRALGIDVPESPTADPEHELYLRLEREEANGAHASYNALVRRVISFAEAAECVS